MVVSASILTTTLRRSSSKSLVTATFLYLRRASRVRVRLFWGQVGTEQAEFGEVILGGKLAVPEVSPEVPELTQEIGEALPSQ